MTSCVITKFFKLLQRHRDELNDMLQSVGRYSKDIQQTKDFTWKPHKRIELSKKRERMNGQWMELVLLQRGMCNQLKDPRKDASLHQPPGRFSVKAALMQMERAASGLHSKEQEDVRQLKLSCAQVWLRVGTATQENCQTASMKLNICAPYGLPVLFLSLPSAAKHTYDYQLHAREFSFRRCSATEIAKLNCPW